MSLDRLIPSDVSTRLRIAREAVGMTQAESARTIGVARTTLVAIEGGHRRIHMSELQELARLYGTSANALLRREAVHVDLVPRFRRQAGGSDEASEKAARLLARLVRAEVELENILGIQRQRNYPPERPLLPGNVRAQAESDATELRQWLGLGLTPIREIITLLDLELGVRVYVKPLDGIVSGLFAYDEVVGACMLLNGNHPRERRALSAVHELGHFVSTRRTPAVLRTDGPSSTREERYADAFGRAFLTPRRTVTQRFQEITAGSSRLTRRRVILLSHAFGVSREAMVRRLEELELTKEGSWDWFQSNGGITDDQARQVLGDLVATDAFGIEAQRSTMLRLNLLAEEVWRRQLLTEGQLARLLQIDRIAVREIVSGGELEGNDRDGVPKLPN